MVPLQQQRVIDAVQSKRLSPLGQTHTSIIVIDGNCADGGREQLPFGLGSNSGKCYGEIKDRIGLLVVSSFLVTIAFLSPL